MNVLDYLQDYLKSLIPNIIINTIKLSKATCHIKIGWIKLATNKTNLKRRISNIVRTSLIILLSVKYELCKS
jgi:hypothetical protein